MPSTEKSVRKPVTTPVDRSSGNLSDACWRDEEVSGNGTRLDWNIHTIGGIRGFVADSLGINGRGAYRMQEDEEREVRTTIRLEHPGQWCALTLQLIGGRFTACKS